MFLIFTFCYYIGMKKELFVFFILFTLFFTVSAQKFVKEAVPQKNQAVVYVSSEDYGPQVKKIVIKLQKAYSQKQIDSKRNSFEITKILFLKDSNTGLSHGGLSFNDVFVSDENGSKLDDKSSYITFLINAPEKNRKYSYEDDAFNEIITNANPFTPSPLSSKFRTFYGYKIENDELDIKITRTCAFVCSEAAAFDFGKSEYTFESVQGKASAVEMNYAYYLPENKNQKVPLILWFHGSSEGGENIYGTLLGIKASALAGEKIQRHFTDGAAVLIPQAPSNWMEAEESGAFGIHYWTPVDKDGIVNSARKIIRTPFDKTEGFLNKLAGKVIVKEDEDGTEEVPPQKESVNDEPEQKTFAAVSLYSKPVKKLLDDFLAQNPQIDRNRIYVGGASAGGYMTVNMLLEYPETFAAAFPVCEYYLDSKISDAQISLLSEKAVWFTYAKNDETVSPQKNSIPTIERIQRAGGGKLHVSEYGSVELNNVIYPGHYSWVYILDDRCTTDGVNLFDWLSRLSLSPI